jgi:uncharacterized protein (TIGR03437 family)
LTLQAYDNCGNSYSDFNTSVSIGNGSQQDLLGVAPSAGKIVHTSPFTIHWKGSVACCSNISPGPAGLTLTVAIDANNPLGGNPLTGSVQMPIAYESDPSAPIVSEGGTVSAASFESVAIAPLEFFSTFGVFPGVNPTSAQTVPLGTSLGGVQVLFDGQPVPLYFVSRNQINGVVPGGALPGPHQIAAIINGILSGTTTVMVGDANPAAFTSDGTTPFLVKVDGSLVSPANPAKVGDTLVMYVQGLGLSSVPVQAGVPAPSMLLPATLPVDLLIGGQRQKVLYAGFTPGSVSLAQINFTVTSAPAAAAGGQQGLSMQIMAGSNVGPVSAVGNFVPDSTLSTVSISVQASYPDAQFNVNGQLITGNSGILTFNAGTQIPLDVPADPQQPSAGTRYYFYGWSQGGNRSQTIAPASSVAIGAYFLASYLLTVNGTATMSPSSPDGYYTQTPSIFIPVTVTGSCPASASPTGLLVSAPSGSITAPNGATIVMDAPKTVTVQCPPPKPVTSCIVAPPGMTAWYSLDEATSPAHDIASGGGGANATWVGNPTPIAGMVAGALSFNGASQVQALNTSEGDIGTGDMSADAWVKTTSMQDQSIVAKGFGYSYSSQYKGYRLGMYAGDPYFTFGDGNAGIYHFSHTFVADGKWHHVAVTLSRSSTTGGKLYVDGVPVLVFDATPNPASWSNAEPLTIGGDQGSFLYNGLGFPFNGGIDEVEIFSRALSATEVGQIDAAGSFGKCKPAAAVVTDTVTTIPPNLNVSIDGGTPIIAPQPLNWVPGTPHTLTAPSPQLNGAGNTQYTLSTTQPWTATLGALITPTGNVASAPSTQSTFTANFNTAYHVTLVLNGCVTGQTNPANLTPGNPVFVTVGGTVQVIISVAASLPNVFQNFVVNPSTNATITGSAVTISPLTGPVTITANCQQPQTVADIVTTNPSGLNVTIDSGTPVATPQTVNWVPGTPHTLTAPSPQLSGAGDTQYTFVSPWTATAGTITPGGSVGSAPATASTYTATFSTAYKVTLSFTGCSAQTNVPGLGPGSSSAFVTKGSSLIVSIAPPSGQTITSVTLNGIAQPTAVPVMINVNPVNGPETIVAACAAVGAPHVVFSLTSRTGGNLSMSVSNTGTATATNVWIDSISVSPSTVVYDPAFYTLPHAVPGGSSVPPGGSGGFNLLFEVSGSTSFTTSFNMLITAHADNEASFTQSVSVP